MLSRNTPPWGVRNAIPITIRFFKGARRRAAKNYAPCKHETKHSAVPLNLQYITAALVALTQRYGLLSQAAREAKFGRRNDAAFHLSPLSWIVSPPPTGGCAPALSQRFCNIAVILSQRYFFVKFFPVLYAII